ncbi:MAG: NAD-glutamate dehydrogenase domain-containing protein, partial [Candidatus Margulisiibacteriota bacterium]
VFGNGMLLSKHIKLVAAFNHMHIFIDPTPDPAKSWRERSRLFKKTRSSWMDYNGISKGGGVFDRSSKEIKCTNEMQALLNINEPIISGEALIQAILKSQVDLLWFGGIGTYIKSSTESHIDVGDPANNSVRINANELNCKIIGEGANLAITQKARIEYELNQGRINTDAIDNSAGVNMSDYEVNIKILLSTLLEQKIIKNQDDRNKILENATNQVTGLVLKNNIKQHELITMDQFRSKQQPFLIDHTISALIKLGRLNHIDEQIPTSKERQELYRQNIPLPRSVLAKCQAYVKMRIKENLTASSLFKGGLYDEIYFNYFPELIQNLVSKDQFPDHRLKQDIIITSLTNHFVGIYGCSSYESITFSGQIKIDQAIHNLVILEQIMNIKSRRDDIRNQNSILDERIPALFEVNESLLYCNLFCHLKGIQLNASQIETYINCLNQPKIKQLPLPLQCVFLVDTNPDVLDRIQKLNTQFGLLTNLELLTELLVSSQVMHHQKISILSDIYKSILQVLDLSARQFDDFINRKSVYLIPLLANQDILPNLFLYSFHLREELSRV